MQLNSLKGRAHSTSRSEAWPPYSGQGFRQDFGDPTLHQLSHLVKIPIKKHFLCLKAPRGFHSYGPALDCLSSPARCNQGSNGRAKPSPGRQGQGAACAQKLLHLGGPGCDLIWWMSVDRHNVLRREAGMESLEDRWSRG